MISLNLLYTKVNSKLSGIPSYRLVSLLYQMAARMSSTKDQDANSFAVIIYNLIKRCCIEHPHHALPIVFALKEYLWFRINYLFIVINKKTIFWQILIPIWECLGFFMNKQNIVVTSFLHLLENYHISFFSKIKI